MINPNKGLSLKEKKYFYLNFYVYKFGLLGHTYNCCRAHGTDVFICNLSSLQMFPVRKKQASIMKEFALCPS